MKYDEEQQRSAFRRTDGCCHICGKKLSFKNYGVFGARGCWEMEHSVARATGGGEHGNNRYPACISCNREKRDGSTRTARAKYGRVAAPLSAAKKIQRRRRNAILAGAGSGLTAVALGATGPVGWAVAGLGALVGHGIEPDPQKRKRKRLR